MPVDAVHPEDQKKGLLHPGSITGWRMFLPVWCHLICRRLEPCGERLPVLCCGSQRLHVRRHCGQLRLRRLPRRHFRPQAVPSGAPQQRWSDGGGKGGGRPPAFGLDPLLALHREPHHLAEMVPTLPLCLRLHGDADNCAPLGWMNKYDLGP